MKNIKKVFSLIMITLAITLSVLTNTATVQAQSNLSASAKWLPYHYDWKHEGWYGNGQIGQLSVNGHDVFCIDIKTAVVVGGGYVSSSLQPHQVSNADQEDFAIWQYIWETTYSKSSVAYATVQMMIWERLLGGTITHDIPDFATRKRDILASASSFDKLPSFNRSSHVLKTNETITLTDTNGVMSDFELPTMEGYTFSKSGNQLTIKAGSTATAKQTSFVKKNIPANYKGSNLIYLKPGSQDLGSFNQIDPPRFSLSLESYNPVGHLNLVKSSENGKLLQNVTYEFSTNADMSKPFATGTTNAQGLIEVKDINADTIVYYREKSTIPNFVLDTTIRNIKIKSAETVTVTPTNKAQRSNVTLKKIENNWDTLETKYNGQALKNTEIGLYAKEDITEDTRLIYRKNDLIGKEITDDNGQVKYHNLPIGEYYAKEIKAPTGFVQFKGQWDISVKYDSVNVTESVTEISETVNNQVIYGKANLVKQDGSNKLLEGAVFGVYNSDDEELMQLTTDYKGRIVTPNLRFGNYYFKELKAPEGYWLSDKKIPFTIDTHEETVYLTVNNESIKARLLVNKTDSETGLPLANATFKIFDKQTNDFVSITHAQGMEVLETDEWTTDNKGQFLIEGYLGYGDYTLIETQAPEGYNLMDSIDFTIDEKQSYIEFDVIGTVLEKDVTNRPIRSDIKVLKIDKNTLEPLKDFEFKLTDLATSEEIILKSNEEGLAVFENYKYGKYMVEEIAVNGEYLIDEVPQFIDITEDSIVYEVIFENEKPLGEIKVLKVDYKTHEPVAKATYGLYKVDNDELVVKGVSDKEGLILFKDLELDKYYIQEIKAPKGYIIDEEKYFVDIDYIDDKTAVIYKEVNIEEMREAELKTSASFTERDVKEPNIVTLTDTVSYENLHIGKEYTVTGFLMNKKTNQPVLIDDEKVTGTTTFIPTKNDDTVDVIFTFDQSKLETETIVVFEDLYEEDIHVIAHHDINDIEQTVSMPKIKTSASFTERDVKEPNIVTLTDTVSYDNLVIGKEYTVNGVLMDKHTNKPLLIDDKEVTGTTTFIAESTKGSVDVMFTLDQSKLETDSIVVFEDLYEEDRLFAVHHDINDIEQTVNLVKITIKKIDSISKEILPNAEFTMYDPQGNVIEVIVTDETGLAEFTIFVGETVEIKETNAPKGYILSDEIVKVSGNDNELDKVIEYPNDLLPVVETGVSSMNTPYQATLVISILCLGFMLFKKKESPIV